MARDAATIAGAQGLHMEIGRIEPGFSADLLLIDPSCFGPHNYPLEQHTAPESADTAADVDESNDERRGHVVDAECQGQLATDARDAHAVAPHEKEEQELKVEHGR